MDPKRIVIEAALASSVALLVLAGCGSDDGKSDDTSQAQGELRCLGGNECKGMSECSGGPGASECKGLNECKGMGWSYVDSEPECTEAGGTIQEEPS
jgi:uncharacterized membrane protein